MTELLGLIAVVAIAYYLKRVRGELRQLQGEVERLERQLKRRREVEPAAAIDRGGAGATAAEEVGRRVAAAVAVGQGAGAESGSGERQAARPAEGRRAERSVAAASSEPAPADLETRLGTTWTLRIGLGAITIAAGLFARAVVPNLSAAVKVVVAYTGALGLVALGRVFEERLARFGRPVMAGGLAIGFFVSFASYFVPAMRAVPLAAALVWMAAGVVAILAVAARWRSEATAGLAVVLGHLSAYVAAGDADGYSLVVILFLSVAAVVLLWRHDWLPLSLVAVVAAYVSHVLWGLADRPGAAPERALLLSLLFLSSYYAVFLAADLLWWRRRAAAGAGTDAVRVALGRSLGPVNVVLYASTAAFLYFATGRAGSLTTYFLAVGAVQFVLTALYLRLRNPDWALYPALGTIFVTIGFASALDALSLDIVLAAEALVLLIAAQRTGMRVLHVLAQAVLATSFSHYVLVPAGAATLPLFAGGVLIALAYFAQATLEERWYAADGWRAGEPPAGLAGIVARRFDAEFRSVAPYLAYVHAAGGAVILVREAARFLSAGAATSVLLTAAAALAVAALLRRSTPLLVAFGVTHVGMTAVSLDAPPEWGGRLLAAAAALLLPLAVLTGARRALSGTQLVFAAAIGHAAAAAGLLLVPPLRAVSTSLYVGAIGAVALVYLYADRARAVYAHANAQRGRMARRFAAIVGVAAVGVIADATGELVGAAATAQQGAWLTVWAVVLLGAAAWRRDGGYYLAGFSLLVLGAFYGWLGAATAPVASLLLIAVVALALGVIQDHTGTVRPAGRDGWIAIATTGIAYLLGTAVLWALFVARIGEPWYVLAAGGVALVIHLMNARAAGSNGRDFAILLMFVVLFVALSSTLDPLTAGTLATLVCALLVAASALPLERLVARSAPGRELFPPRYAATALLVGATVLALVALDSSAWRNGAFTTVGYSITGAALMALGFAVRSARHRRIALAVFALTLARAFLDTGALSDTGKTVAFLVLGLALVAVAWLYSRYAARIREWL